MVFTIRRLLYLIFITSAALAALVFFNDSEKYWLIWTVYSLAFIPFHLNFKKRIQIVLLSGIGMIVCVFVTSLIILPLWQVAIFLMIIISVNMFLAEVYSQLYFSTFMIALFAIVAHLTAVPLIEDLKRSIFIVMSVGVALIAQFIFWPYCFSFEIKSSMRNVIKQLTLLNNEFYSCYLEPAYKENLYLYESRLHHQKNRCMLALQQFGKVLTGKNQQLKWFQQQFETLFATILDQAQIRWRVTDHTTFGLCRNELLSLATEFENIFAELARGLHQKKYHINLQGLNEKIKRFEENNQTVLQVAAREPLVFLLFIANLKEMSAQIAILYRQFLDEALMPSNKTEQV